MTIQRADSGARRCAIAALLMVLIVATLAYFAIDRWMSGVLALEPADARRNLLWGLQWMSITIFFVIVAFGVYLFALGRRVVKLQRFPPPGFPVIKDTEILEGDRARMRGLLIQRVSILLIIASLALPFLTFRVATLLG